MRGKAYGLTKGQKAAVLLVALGPEVAGRVVRNLSEHQIEALTLEVAKLDQVPVEQREHAISEFYQLAASQEFIAEGGVDSARRVLESAFGRDKADEMIERVAPQSENPPFAFLKEADPAQVLSLVQEEHPQTIALILTYLPLSTSAAVLAKLPKELRSEVASRIAAMDHAMPEAIREVEEALALRVSGGLGRETIQPGGPRTLVEILNRVDRSTERVILESLSDTNPDLAEAVKSLMFTFNDIVQLDDRAVQSILREIDMQELSTAMRGASTEVQQKIFKNMSERAVSMLKEDMEYMGPVRLRVVEDARQRIVGVIRRLEQAGEIVVGRSDDEEVFV